MSGDRTEVAADPRIEAADNALFESSVSYHRLGHDDSARRQVVAEMLAAADSVDPLRAGQPNDKYMCQWCLAASQQLRAATGDPTARAYCTEHRAPVVGGEEPLKEKIARALYEREFPGWGMLFGPERDQWLSQADAVLAVIQPEIDKWEQRASFWQTLHDAVAEQREDFLEERDEALRALAALVEACEQWCGPDRENLPRRVVGPLDTAQAVLDRFGRGE